MEVIIIIIVDFVVGNLLDKCRLLNKLLLLIQVQFNSKRLKKTMFHVVNGQHQILQYPAAESLLADAMTDSEDQRDRISEADFSKLDPLNPNGYM